MPHLSREEAVRRGIKVKPVIHRMTRRNGFHNYFLPGTYGITVHLLADEKGLIECGAVLGEIVGDISAARTLVDGRRNPAFPKIRLSEMGRLVERKIQEIGTHKHEEHVRVVNYCIMPTHIHMTVVVTQTLPKQPLKKGGYKQIHLGHIIGYFKSGCTGWFRRWMDGESVEEIFAKPTWRDVHGGWLSPQQTTAENGSDTNDHARQNSTHAENGNGTDDHARQNDTNENGCTLSLWDENYNDKNLYTRERQDIWDKYVDMNAYYWKLQMDYPHLFEHRLHIKIGETDYSSYGCLFLLKRMDRIQVFCHRAARKGMLTSEEWKVIADNITNKRKTAQEYEEAARVMKLGRFSWDWVSSRDPECIVPIPYTETEAFKAEKARIMKECREGCVAVSPAISEGEKDIFYSLLEEGLPCIKLQDKPLDKGVHAHNKDREYCSKGLLLVLGPWDIDDNGKSIYEKDSKHFRFHNLNGMVEKLCSYVEPKMTIDKRVLASCQSVGY